MAFSIVLMTIFSITTVVLCHNMDISPFTRDVICDVTGRIDRGCSQKMESYDSIIQCVAICASKASCIGASLDENGQCFVHDECPQLPLCLGSDTNHRYMTPYCVHGTWNPLTRVCECVDYALGDRCNEFMKDCGDLLNAPDHVFGEHKVLIDPDGDGLNPVYVVCRTRSPNHWSILILRNEGKINFNRTWEEYKKGFYVDFYNLWAGLDAWYHLSTAGCNRLTAVLTFDVKPITRLQRKHTDFVLEGESVGYKFTVASSESDSKGTPPAGTYFGDCLGSLQNIPMSTWDRDNDGDSTENCAARAGSGWWYSGCDNPCNILGYGYDYWFTKPRQELFSVEGVDMDAHASTVAFLTMFLKC